MNKSGNVIWQERADYVDTLLFLKHKTFEKRSYTNTAPVVQQISVKAAIIQSLRKRFTDPKVFNNPIVKVLFKIKKALGIKFS